MRLFLYKVFIKRIFKHQKDFRGADSYNLMIGLHRDFEMTFPVLGNTKEETFPTKEDVFSYANYCGNANKYDINSVKIEYFGEQIGNNIVNENSNFNR